MFDLSLEALESGKYRVTVLDSPAGTASEEIDAPFSFAELADLNDVLAGRGVDAKGREAALKAAGEKLFGAILSNGIRYAYTTSLTRAGAGGLTLRLRLDRAGDLSGLPWPLLREGAEGATKLTRLDAPPASRPVGGAREFLQGGRLAAVAGAAALLIILVALALLVVRRPESDVDLAVTSLRFLPSKPSPGQIFTVSIGIKNNGTTDSGAFNWAWFKDDFTTAPRPDLSSRVENLEAGKTITVRGSFSFGWWDEYNSTAWVNFDGKAPDRLPFNNLSKPTLGFIQTSDAPFVIDFNVLPNGESLQEARELRGDEFRLWDLTILPDASAKPNCAKAVIKLSVVVVTNSIMTGLPSAAAGCDDLPIQVTLQHSIGGAAVEFTAAQAGRYTLTLLDPQGNLAPLTLDVSAPGSYALRLPADGSPVLDRAVGVQRIVIQGAAGMSIQQISFFQPTSNAP